VIADPWEQTVLAVALGAARTLPVTWLVPVLGGPRVSSQVRLGLGVLLAVLCLPVLVPAVDAVAGTPGAAGWGPVWWLILLARELMVGVTVGLCAGAVFRAAEAAGRLVDIARGANSAGLLSAEAGERGSATGDLYLFVAAVLFLELGGLRLMGAALVRSYEAVPIGAAPAREALRSAAGLVVLATGRLIESAVVLASPVIVAMVLADVVLGLVGRLVPQIPVYFTALPAKALLGLGVVLLGLGALDAAWTAGFPSWMVLVDRAFLLWRPQ
jgi:type III secretory pathway component EscT